MQNQPIRIGSGTQLNLDFDATIVRVTEALKAEGFGILTEIDVKETLKKKLNVEFRRYKILGACNPPLAHRALTATSDAGLLLPCNVTVAEVEAGVTEVNIVDPVAMLGVLAHPDVDLVAQEAAEKVARVLAALEQS